MIYNWDNIRNYSLGPDGLVQSVSFPDTRFKRDTGAGREWVCINNGKRFTNFAAVIGEYPSGVQDILTPVQEAREYFRARGGTIQTSDLISTFGKKHAAVLINELLKPVKTSQPW